ncbi:MAG TPA: 2-phosphosulfolactate phosphatase [bacterium]|nr:2-phosphosulfolactate phosphatase [bacterium]HPO99594.1 2-phosphosulfolactate phosphatase [bacterium]
MLLDVALTWKELPGRDLSQSIVVIADILRATTVITAALSNGAVAIYPQDSDENARACYNRLAAAGVPVLICGEKEGFKRPGYDLGNSPLEFTSNAVSGKTLVHLTTNGTRALVAASAARRVVILSFHNLSAVTRALQNDKNEVQAIQFTVSGKEGRFCLEDTVCLGGVIAGLLEPPGHDYEITDAARAAVDLYYLYKDQLLNMVQQCEHGRYLQQIGLGDDLPACVQVDTTAIIPLMLNGVIQALASPEP